VQSWCLSTSYWRNRCGVCCAAGACKTAQLFFDVSSSTKCPALQWDDHGAVCGLMADAARYAPVRARIQGVTTMSQAAKRLEGAGGGCNCHYTNEPYDDTIRRRLPVKRRADLKIWGLAKKADAAAKEDVE
jgi:hypothetical protein